MNKDLFKNSISKISDPFYEVDGLSSGDYDQQAVQYDRLISNGLYNRMMWGNSPKNYLNFCRKGLEQNDGGVIADIGCGTLGFTYPVYAESDKESLYLCDLSAEMMYIGAERLQKARNNLSGITFLRSDALNLPFRENAIRTVLCFGLLHIFEDPALLIKELVRVLEPGGQVFLTSLCTDRRFSARYLRLLKKKGHVASVMSSGEIRQLMEENGIHINSFEVIGGMTYVSGSISDK